MASAYYRLYFEKHNHTFSQSKGLLLPDSLSNFSRYWRLHPIYIAPIRLVNTSDTEKKQQKKIEISIVLDWNKYD